MRTKAFIALPKAITKAGEWKCGALTPKHKMGVGAFPLGPRRPFRLGNQWWWRVDLLQCGPYPGRLLTAYHLAKNNYVAYLSIERIPGQHTVVASLEHHSTHGSWHWHTKCADLDDFAPGCTRQRISGIRIPGKGRYNRDRGYQMGPQEAVNRSYKAFRVTAVAEKGELL